MNPVFSCLVGGVLPFGAVFIELFFILTSMWLHQFYYLFGFLALVFVILIITCAEISIVLCYFQVWLYGCFYGRGVSPSVGLCWGGRGALCHFHHHLRRDLHNALQIPRMMMCRALCGVVFGTGGGGLCVILIITCVEISIFTRFFQVCASPSREETLGGDRPCAWW